MCVENHIKHNCSKLKNMQNNPKFDPYKILGVSRNDSLADIKIQYYRLVKKYHPDRQQGDDKKMNIITKAYNIVSDPSLRAEFDSSYSAGHNDLQYAYKNFESYQAKATPADSTVVKGKFSEGDLKDFNSQFESRRGKDPNSRGYESEMVPRTSADDIVSGQRRDTVETPQNLFASGQFNPQLFNRMFEEATESTSLNGGGMIERNDEDLCGYSLLGGSQFSEIAVYNGAIIDREVEDFTKCRPDASGSLNYTDYKQGYSNKPLNSFDQATISQLKQKEDMFSDQPLSKADMKRLYKERVQEYSSPINTEIPKEDRKRKWQEDEWKLEEQRNLSIKREQERNRDIVFKYKDQYPEHILSDLNLRNQLPDNNNQQLPQAHAQQQQQIYAKDATPPRNNNERPRHGPNTNFQMLDERMMFQAQDDQQLRGESGRKSNSRSYEEYMKERMLLYK